MADEMIDIVDENNHILRSVTKTQAHKLGHLHRTVIGEFRDHDGNIVLVKQASDRQDAGQYVSPVGGHARTGESEEDALKREAMEEIGLKDFEYQLLGRFIYERHVLGRHENHYFIVYQITGDPTAIKLGEESVEHRTFTTKELATALKVTPEIFGAALIAVLEQFNPELLPA